MKKITTILLGLVMASSLFAQFDLGIKIGGNYTYHGTEDYQIYLEELEYLSNVKSYLMGVFVGANSGNVGVQLEVAAPLEGFSLAHILYSKPLSQVVENTSLNYEYLSATLMLRYELNLLIIKPYLGGGLNVGIPLMDLINEESEVEFTDIDPDQLGFAICLGINILDFLDVDVRYTNGVTDIVTKKLNDDDVFFGEQVRLSLGLHIF